MTSEQDREDHQKWQEDWDLYQRQNPKYPHWDPRDPQNPYPGAVLTAPVTTEWTVNVLECLPPYSATYFNEKYTEYGRNLNRCIALRGIILDELGTMTDILQPLLDEHYTLHGSNCDGKQCFFVKDPKGMSVLQLVLDDDWDE